MLQRRKTPFASGSPDESRHPRNPAGAARTGRDPRHRKTRRLFRSSGLVPPPVAWSVTKLCQALPADLGMSYVLVSHLDPLHPSSLADLLGRTTRMPVREVIDGTTVEPDHVYVIPPNTSLTIAQGVLRLAPRGHSIGPAMPVDHFLRSLAADQHRPSASSCPGPDRTVPWACGLWKPKAESPSPRTPPPGTTACRERHRRRVRGLRPTAGRHRTGADPHQPAPVRQQRGQARAGRGAGGGTGGRARSDPPPTLSGPAEGHRAGLHPVQVRDAPPANPAADDPPPTGAVAGLRRVCARRSRGASGPLPGHADQRHQLLPRPGVVRCAEDGRVPRTAEGPRSGQPHPRVGAGLCQRRGGVLPGHLPAGIPRRWGGGTTDQALRDRRE